MSETSSTHVRTRLADHSLGLYVRWLQLAMEEKRWDGLSIGVLI